MQYLRLAVITLTLFFPSVASSITGNEWRGLPEMPKTMYVSTTLEGWRFAEAYHDVMNNSEYASLLQCWWKGLTVGQFIAMVEKHMNSHPEEWHEAMPIIMIYTLKEACPK